MTIQTYIWLLVKCAIATKNMKRVRRHSRRWWHWRREAIRLGNKAAKWSNDDPVVTEAYYHLMQKAHRDSH